MLIYSDGGKSAEIFFESEVDFSLKEDEEIGKMGLIVVF